jgi:hypothetical protein
MADVKLSELEQLNLDEARERAADRVSKRAQRTARMKSMERSLKDNDARQKDIQSRCFHKKGGKGVGMLYQGNDSNYAIIKHTLSHGPTILLCQRCKKQWDPPDRSLIGKGATAESRALYRRQAEEYQWAMNAPTDNEPSGTVLFAFSEPEPAFA